VSILGVGTSNFFIHIAICFLFPSINSRAYVPLQVTINSEETNSWL
jgi:hypothetical protein